MKQFKNKNIIKLPFELQPVLVESVYFPLQISNLRFESSVILNGSKTNATTGQQKPQFESSVILNGSKTYPLRKWRNYLFESSVILNGSKTNIFRCKAIAKFESSVILNGSKTFFRNSERPA